MPASEVNLVISNLSVHTLRRVHRKARCLAFQVDLPLPVVIAWWLEKIPASVTASQQVEMLGTGLELSAFMSRRHGKKGAAR